MSTGKHYNTVSIIAVVIAVVIAAVFLFAGITAQADGNTTRQLGYEDKLFDHAKVHTILPARR